MRLTILTGDYLGPTSIVLVVGGGQSGAKIVEHMLNRPEPPPRITWVTARSNLFAMDDTSFVNEAYIPGAFMRCRLRTAVPSSRVKS